MLTKLAPPNADRDLGASGAMSVEELRAEPVLFDPDIAYGSDHERQRLDVYRPKVPAANGTVPVIVFLHGGGWSRGDKSDGARRVLPFVKTGRYAAVSADYRLSGDAVWPAQLHDCKAVIRWIRANADTWGFDAAHLGVWGRDAGAHLALLLGTTGDAPVLVVHGTMDRVVPFTQAKRLDGALREAGVPSILVAVDGGGHGDFGSLADERVDAFFARVLRGEARYVPSTPLRFR